MTTDFLGYNEKLEHYRTTNQLTEFIVGRIVSEHRDRYRVLTEEAGDLDAELIGNLRYTAARKSDLPIVGDWVAVSPYDEDKALIHAVFPRWSLLERKALGKSTQHQPISANVDFAFIVQAVNRDFSLNRLERYIALCHSAKVTPVILLSKVDLVDEVALAQLNNQLKLRLKGVQLLFISNENGTGITALKEEILPGKTYCLLGSSGVGKSTLINQLMDQKVMETKHISTKIDRGKHTTSHRQLLVLPTGAMIIDNPGMREVGITDEETGLTTTFSSIVELARECQYSDCTHQHEKGCAVQQALSENRIDPATYANFRKMERERSFLEATAGERRQKEKKQGKLYKSIQQERRRNKY
jgi:ribosome biogenesis GTPase